MSPVQNGSLNYTAISFNRMKKCSYIFLLNEDLYKRKITRRKKKHHTDFNRIADAHVHINQELKKEKNPMK